LNLFKDLPEAPGSEVLQTLLQTRHVRIERIVSPPGTRSPDSGWFEEEDHEWVLILSGSADVVFEDGSAVRLGAGEPLLIPARRRHRVERTDPDLLTVWLAIFYPNDLPDAVEPPRAANQADAE
jgi:cupin 2 domain-containing protein